MATKPKLIIMKKSILLFLLLIPVFALAQDSTLVEPSEAVIPDWISYALNAVLVVVSGWLAGAKIRLAKAVTLLDTLSRALEDGSLSKVEISAIVAQAKELVRKEK